MKAKMRSNPVTGEFYWELLDNNNTSQGVTETYPSAAEAKANLGALVADTEDLDWDGLDVQEQ